MRGEIYVVRLPVFLQLFTCPIRVLLEMFSMVFSNVNVRSA